MKVDVILSPGEAQHYNFTGKTCVVIDVFRFTTTILTALEAGIERFFPVSEVEEAFKLKEANPGLLLAGERNALRVPGFDFGNSPLEHFGKNYAGGQLVCSTTNGTRAIQAARGAQKVILACLRSAQAVASFIQDEQDVLFLPAGLAGKFSLEDTWCAGLMLSYLQNAELGDGAKVARLIYEEIPHSKLAESAHGKRLQSLELWKDLEFCLEVNVSSGVVLWDQDSGWGALV